MTKKDGVHLSTRARVSISIACALTPLFLFISNQIAPPMPEYTDPGPLEGSRRLLIEYTPARREGFSLMVNKSAQRLYDGVWTGRQYPKGSCFGCRFAWQLASKLDFETVLDVGTGNGMAVREFRQRGKLAWGIDISQGVLDTDAPDLLQNGWVEQSSLTNLPYADKTFDLVYSSDVLEHISPEEVDAAVAEMVRVARKHIVLSISLKSHMNERLHTMLRPRQWWEAKFQTYGGAPDRTLVWALQDKDTFPEEDRKDCRMEGDASDGGMYEVCIVPSVWLVGRPGQETRSYRCMTTVNSELEPWIFAFRKNKW